MSEERPERDFLRRGVRMIPRETAEREARLFFGFGIVGTTGFIVDATIFQIGLFCGLSHEIARLISVLIALQVTFLANGLIVFKHGTPFQLLRRWPFYMLSNGFSALCNYGIFIALVHSRHPLIQPLIAKIPLIAVVISTGCAMFISFAGMRLFVFRRAAQPD